MKFNEVFQNLRKSKGMTQEELAKALGTSRSAIGMYENGKREPAFEMEEKIADYFNVSLDYLRTGKAAPVPTDGQTIWYLNPEVAEIAQTAFESPDLRVLFDLARDADPEDIRLAIEMLRRMKGTNPDG